MFKIIKSVGEHDSLEMHQGDMRFYGFKSANMITVTFATYENANTKAANNSEYYLESEWDMAEKAFEERLNGDRFKKSSFARPLEVVLKDYVI